MEVYDRLDFETEKKMTYSKIMKPLIFFANLMSQYGSNK